MQEKTKSALLRKYPEQVVLVTTRSSSGKANVMAVGWAAIASGDPLMFVLGISDESFTYRLITETRQFVVAFPSEHMGHEVRFVGSRHGHDIDKIAESGLKTQSASIVAAPLIAEAVANFECELVEIHHPGDCPLVIGRVVAEHENADPGLKRVYTVGRNHLMGRISAVATAGEA